MNEQPSSHGSEEQPSSCGREEQPSISRARGRPIRSVNRSKRRGNYKSKLVRNKIKTSILAELHIALNKWNKSLTW